ncbi:MAG: metal-sulfur cluster assembly factor [Acidobacteria bacterium]|nr:metal-sulfur cluster assembly factor [Acidobacteriota bacterium]
MPTREQVIEVIKDCYDPEIPVNIYDLGLIYDIQAGEQEVTIQMTLTSAACPSAAQIPEELRCRIQEAFGVRNVLVNLTFDPPWEPTRITPEGRKILMLEE